MNNPYERRYEDNLTESERISRDWENERREERRYQKELLSWNDFCDSMHAIYRDMDQIEKAIKPAKKPAGWTTQMDLFDEEVA